MITEDLRQWIHKSKEILLPKVVNPKERKTTQATSQMIHSAQAMQVTKADKQPSKVGMLMNSLRRNEVKEVQIVGETSKMTLREQAKQARKVGVNNPPFIYR
jgi:hypothetical protein